MMDITVIQPHEYKDWTSIPNRLILDELLKSDEIRLYCYLKSRPSNWQYNSGHIRKLFGWSKNKASSVMSSLRKNGWIAIEQEKTGDGKFSGSVRCFILVEPTPYPKIAGNREDRDTANPKHGKTVARKNSDLNNNDYTNKTELSKKTLSFSDFRETLAKNEFCFEINNGLCDFTVGTKFKVKQNGYITCLSSSKDIDSDDAKTIWEELFKKQRACLRAISDKEVDDEPNS
jgi:hypothetical protein